MKLYRVEIERVFYVLAEDEREAERETELTYAREDDTDPDCVMATEVTKISTVPEEWLRSRPWGGDDDSKQTIQDWWQENHQPPPFKDTLTIYLFQAP